MGARRPRRVAALLLGGFALLAALTPAHAATSTCGGFAPNTTHCSTGTHTEGSTISHDVQADLAYAGTVESVLTWGGGNQRIFRCTYTQALRRACVASGSFPPPNTAFSHSCRSLVPESAVNPGSGVKLDGIEGGVGTWGCSVTF